MSTFSFGTLALTDIVRGPGEYVGLPPLSTVEEIREWLNDHGISVSVLGSNFANQPLLAIKTGQGSGRPIVITAGAHAGEPSGVLAALLLARDYVFHAPTYIIPLRDPFAWQGFQRTLHYATDGQPAEDVSDYASAVGALEARGDLIFNDGELIISEAGGVVFATMPPASPPIGPRQLEQAVNDVMSNSPELAERLRGKRVVFPSNAGLAEGVGDYERAFSATIRGTGVVADMNRGFGGSEEPSEVEIVRQLVDEVHPGLVLDLHEGQGASYYVFVSADSPHRATNTYAQSALEAMGAEGHGPVTLDDLERSFGSRIREGLSEPFPGMMVGRVQSTRLDGTSFGNYCDRYCPSITLETGRWARLSDRVRWQLQGASAILDRYRADVG